MSNCTLGSTNPLAAVVFAIITLTFTHDAKLERDHHTKSEVPRSRHSKDGAQMLKTSGVKCHQIPAICGVYHLKHVLISSYITY